MVWRCKKAKKSHPHPTQFSVCMSTPRLSRQSPVIRSNQSCFGQINHVLYVVWTRKTSDWPLYTQKLSDAEKAKYILAPVQSGSFISFQMVQKVMQHLVSTVITLLSSTHLAFTSSFHQDQRQLLSLCCGPCFKRTTVWLRALYFRRLPTQTSLV